MTCFPSPMVSSADRDAARGRARRGGAARSSRRARGSAIAEATGRSYECAVRRRPERVVDGGGVLAGAPARWTRGGSLSRGLLAGSAAALLVLQMAMEPP